MNIINQMKMLFKETPSNIQGIRELLSSRKFTTEELAEVAVSFTEECMGEGYYEIAGWDVDVEDIHSNYIVEAIKLLLEYGLDSNVIVNGEANVMRNAQWISYHNQAARVMQLLLDHGGNPNLLIEQETLFESIDDRVSYDEYEDDNMVQCWLMLMAYGGCFESNGEIPLTMLNGNSVEIFKNIECYHYEIESPTKENGLDCWIMHIYNVETKEEVARY